MWVFTNEGILSIVTDRNDSTRLLVRARKKGLIQKHFSVEEEQNLSADYEFRVFLEKEVVAETVSRLLLEIDYDNFKGSIKDDKYHDKCLQVWSTMN